MDKTILGKHLFILLFSSTLAWGQSKVGVINFSASECKESVPNANMLRTRIIERNFINGILEVKIGTTETCCLTFSPVVKYYESKKQDMDTLYFGYKTYGDPCECDCYYEFIYKVKIISSNFEIQFKGKPIELNQERYYTFPLQYKVIDKDQLI